MVEESIRSAVVKYLDALRQQGMRVEFGVLFGSQVTGKTHRWSDIDLLIVSPLFDGERRREDISRLWKIAARTDSRIEPIAVGKKQFEEDRSSPIIEMARREGQIISLTNR